jgi:hypothetical protein
VLKDDEWSKSGVSAIKEVLRDGDPGVFGNVLCCGSLLEGFLIWELDQTGTGKSDHNIGPRGNSFKMHSVEDVEAANNQRRNDRCPCFEPLLSETLYLAASGFETYMF